MPEVIPELAYVIGLFFAVVGYLTARGLLATWTHSIGFVLAWLGTHARIRIHVPHIGGFHIDFGGPFRAADHAIITALQVWANGAETEMGYCLHGMEKVARYTAQAIDFLARETTQTFEWMLHVRLPKWAKWIAAAALPPALIAKLLRAAIAHALPHIRTATRTVTHDVTHSVTRIVRNVVHTAVAFPPWVIRLPQRVGHVERDISKLTRRLHKVEAFAAAGVFAGLLANALGVSLRCVRRGNVGRAARSVCGMDASLFESLLGDLVAVASVLSVVEFANELRSVEDEALSIAGRLIREFPA